ncbi:envelope stress response membrane protein PspC [Pseudaeromonas sharmana]|uniref:Envelope stress response membrane protein PspC n=1 Tax=Pseudaeromonas sharmana TaxID=328412 RepID=A0ABV8CNP5_9GAMM
MSQRMYRDPSRGALAGVCTGLADYFGVEVWVIRLGVATGLIFATLLTVLLYLIAWGMLPKRDELAGAEPLPTMKQHGWQKGVSPAQALTLASERLAELELRVQRIERCVTSKAYRIRRDLKGL